MVGKRPFQGGTGLELASSILKDAPSSVVELRSDVPFHLGRIIHHCLEKDPERRFQSAKDVRNELEELRREVDSGILEASRSSAGGSPGGGSPALEMPGAARRGRTWILGTALGLLLATAVFALWWTRGRAAAPRQPLSPPASVTTEAQPTVAVLPFRNMGADESVDYLRLAAPDEITTTLSRVSGLAVWPFAPSSQDTPLDPLESARELAGRYYFVGN